MEMTIESQIEEDVRVLDAFADRSHVVREKIINKLESVVDSFKLDPDNEKPTAIEAKMNVINTLLKSLSDAESTKITLIKMKQRNRDAQEDEDSMKTIARTVAEYMKGIHTQTNTQSTGESTNKDGQLDKASTEANIELLAGELEVLGNSAQDISLG